jgi:hypothetical protein
VCTRGKGAAFGRDLVRRLSIFVAKALLSSLPLMMSADLSLAQESKVPRVGVILNDRPGLLFDTLRRGLADLGYVEGRNVIFEARLAAALKARSSEGDRQRSKS